MARRPLVAGNWKMHGLQSSAGELQKIIAGAKRLPKVELMVCPPATLVASFAAAARGSRVLIGGQDCHALPSGAYTGDISAEMLKDAGAVAVIVGHSERRQYHGETDAAVRAKAEAARRAGIVAIVCVGETRAEREAGQAFAVVGTQLEGSLSDDATGFVIAYEPVWAIGTGLTQRPPMPAICTASSASGSVCATARRGKRSECFTVARSIRRTRRICYRSRMWMVRLSVVQASRPMSSWLLPLFTDSAGPP